MRTLRLNPWLVGLALFNNTCFAVETHIQFDDNQYEHTRAPRGKAWQSSRCKQSDTRECVQPSRLEAFEHLGAVEVADMLEIDEDDLTELGLPAVQRKRFKAALLFLPAAPDFPGRRWVGLDPRFTTAKERGEPPRNLHVTNLHVTSMYNLVNLHVTNLTPGSACQP